MIKKFLCLFLAIFVCVNTLACNNNDIGNKVTQEIYVYGNDDYTELHLTKDKDKGKYLLYKNGEWWDEHNYYYDDDEYSNSVRSFEEVLYNKYGDDDMSYKVTIFVDDDIYPTACNQMFRKFGHNYFVDNKSLKKLHTDYVTDMHRMFKSCANDRLDLAHFNTKKVEDFSEMFEECKLLQELNIENWDVSNAIEMYSMFYECPVKRPSWYKE